MTSKPSVLNSFMLIVGSSATAQLIFFIGTLVLARLYSPESFGGYGVLASMAALVSVVSGLRFDYLAFLPEAEKYRRESFYFAAVSFSVVFCGLAVFFIAWSGSLDPEVGWSLTFFFILSASLVFLGGQRALACAEYKQYSRIRVVQSASQVVFGFVFYWIFPELGMIVAFVVSQFTLGIWLLFDCFQGVYDSKLSALRSIAVVRGFGGRALLNTVSTGLQYSAPLAPILLGGYFFKSSEVGAYFVVSQIFAAPLGILRRSFLSFLNAEASSPEKAEAILVGIKKEFLMRVLGGGCLVMASLLSVFWFFGSSVVTILIGVQWVGYSYLLMPLAAYFMIDAVLQPFSTLAPLWRRGQAAFLFELFRFFLVYVLGLALIEVGVVSFICYIYFFVASMIFVYLLQVLYVVRVMRGWDA